MSRRAARCSTTASGQLRASATVLSVSYASRGDTSNDTQPSTPRVASQTGRSSEEPDPVVTPEGYRRLELSRAMVMP